MSLVLGFVCFAIAIMAILVIIKTAIRPVRKSAPYRDKVRTPQVLAAIARLDELEGKPQKKARKRKPTHHKDSTKYKKLLGMLNGDREVADNLVRVYGVDKAIEDLIRDRR